MWRSDSTEDVLSIVDEDIPDGEQSLARAQASLAQFTPHHCISQAIDLWTINNRVDDIQSRSGLYQGLQGATGHEWTTERLRSKTHGPNPELTFLAYSVRFLSRLHDLCHRIDLILLRSSEHAKRTDRAHRIYQFSPFCAALKAGPALFAFW